ncbi:MAG: class I SAM-dependent methyltransferase [Lachnospiraceae bacterium]|nr:class I SAM-dependent methyltransferase [Lachnospiraceae bacterium]
MRGDRKAYALMYERISRVIQGKDVLEAATGPGLLAKHVAQATHKMIATDYSDGMIKEAKKGNYPDNLTFEVADAEHLPYRQHFTDPDVIRHDLQHEELLVYYPQRWVREVENCCSILTGE